MSRLTFEDLARQLQNAGKFPGTTMPRERLIEVLDLAARVKRTDAFDLDRLRKASKDGDVTLTGAELRYVLALAIQALQPRTASPIVNGRLPVRRSDSRR